MPAPTWRRGAKKAALDAAGVRHDELATVEGALEPPRASAPPKRPPLALTAPTGDTPQEYAPQAAMLSMRALVEDVLYGDGRDRAMAAHALAQVSAKFLPADAPVEPPLTPEARAARLDANLAAPDAELAAALERNGLGKLAPLREALMACVAEIDFLTSGGDDPHDRCIECGLPGVGMLRDARSKAAAVLGLVPAKAAP